MKGSSKNYPAKVVDFNPGFQIRWNIQEVDVQQEDGSTTTEYSYEFNHRYIPKKLTKKEIMIAIIRESYDVDDELELAYGREEDVAKIAAHEQLINDARTKAETIINEQV